LKSLEQPDASAYPDALPNRMRSRSNHNHNHNYNHNHNHHHDHHRQDHQLQSAYDHPLPSVNSIPDVGRKRGSIRPKEKTTPIEYNGPVGQDSRPETAEELDERRRLFDTGLPILQTISGKPEHFCRAKLKKLLENNKQNCRLLADLCEQAKSEKPAKVFDWLAEKTGAVTPEVEEGGSEKIEGQPR
jgi:hypothetical protein